MSVKVCEKCVEDGEKLVDEMETEARSAPLQFRSGCFLSNTVANTDNLCSASGSAYVESGGKI